MVVGLSLVLKDMNVSQRGPTREVIEVLCLFTSVDKWPYDEEAGGVTWLILNLSVHI